MLEIIIERWRDLDRTTSYRWSIWRDGRRVAMGGPHASQESAEAAAEAHCREAGETADRVTVL